MKLEYIKLRPGASAPRRETPGAAGMDLCALPDGELTIAPMERRLVPTGLAIAVPEGCAGFVMARSGLSYKHGVTLTNAVGLIDSDYRGELLVSMINLSDSPYTIRPGDRIAQLVIVPIAQPEPEEAAELTQTARAAGGFGSTGK